MTRVSKASLVALLRNRGEFEAAARAHAEFPDEVDDHEHSALLESYGIDAEELRHARPDPAAPNRSS